jgi:hypothetical protein
MLASASALAFPQRKYFQPLELKNSKVLFCSPEAIVPDGAEECVLQDLDPKDEARRRQRAHGNAYDEDDDPRGMGGPGRVQCATQ